MSRNLSEDCCVECGYGPVQLSDLIGRPVELRTVGKYVPRLGTRWDCPRCQCAYFAAYETRGDCPDCFAPDNEQSWSIDLSYWSSYNDEPDDDRRGEGKPHGLILKGRAGQQTEPSLQAAKRVPNPGLTCCPCCGRGPDLSAVAGKPLELRSTAGEVPRAGVRFDCACGTAYFVHYRTRGMCVRCAISPARWPDWEGTWELDLYYWSSYGNEPEGDLLGLGPARGLVAEAGAFDETRFYLTDLAAVLDLLPPVEPGTRSRPSALAERVRG